MIGIARVIADGAALKGIAAICFNLDGSLEGQKSNPNRKAVAHGHLKKKKVK